MNPHVDPPEQTITLKQRAEYWVAIHEETGVGAQGATRTEALAELDEAVALHTNDVTDPVEDEETVLQELGIDTSHSRREHE